MAQAGYDIRTARAMGFCDGVKEAVRKAKLASARHAEARRQGRAGRLFLLGQIIHNPRVNRELRESGIQPLDAAELGQLQREDWVIVPAFGAPVPVYETLQRIGCTVIDTTCGWVKRVWAAAQRFSGAGLTVVIHGKPDHEETLATRSRIPGPHLVVSNIEEASRLAEAIRRGSDAKGEQAAWFNLPKEKTGGRFDPSVHLDRMGLVNQTTMLSSESRAIERMLESALRQRLGAPPGPERFQSLGTFCPATQERQDAVRTLIEEFEPDLMLVIGGFNSSNTGHLARIASERVRTFHIRDRGDLIGRARIRHLPVGAREPVIEANWLPQPPARIGITAGASTPDEEIAALIEMLESLAETGARPSRSEAGNEEERPWP